MTAPDAWGRVLSPVERTDGGETFVRRREGWILAILRSGLLLGGMFLALATSFVLGYAGLGPIALFWAQLSLAPLAVVCWFLASFTDAGDRWTLAYISIWAFEAVVVTVGSMFLW